MRVRKKREMFLFHTGSIKSEKIPRNAESRGQFLFHTGSIKSLWLLYTDLAPKKCYVSIPYWFD